MADNWSERERQTNRLVRLIAAWLFAQKKIEPEQLIGLIRLTWITASHVNEGKYITSLKIPALGNVFGQDYAALSLSEVARDVSSRVGSPKARQLILCDTGFTNIYNAYRNSSDKWVRRHFKRVLPLVKAAYRLSSDAEARELANAIDRLPLIGKQDQQSSKMNPASVLTPIAFALDKRIRFPIVNGREHVKQILREQGVANGTLADQFDAMISLYGKAGIHDAADLDQSSDELEHFLTNRSTSSDSTLLKKKRETGKRLPLKDDSDLGVVQKERASARKRLHNNMTNKLRTLWKGYTLTEGKRSSAQYDVMIENYDTKGHDLIVEVKSSAETPNLRMAVGQLLSYSFRLRSQRKSRLCILVPGKPSVIDTQWLASLKVGLMWFSGSKLKTKCGWLAHLARE